MLALLVFAPSAFSQGSTGRLVGSVTDPGGAVIPGATVTVKDNQTGREVTAAASGEGGFAFSQLQVGSYTVTITATGYSTFIATDVKIDSNRDNTLNVAMTVGGVKENVTVVGGADIVNSANGELSNTVSEKQVKELPISGRSLASNAPGGESDELIDQRPAQFINKLHARWSQRARQLHPHRRFRSGSPDR